MASLAEGRTTRRFHHEAAFYSDQDEFLAAAVPFLREGLEAEEPILVAVNEEKIRTLREELNGGSDSVEFVDMETVGRNPARIIPVWRNFAELNLREGRPMRGIGEPVWPERSDAELAECDIHESLLNLAFADSPPWSLLCPYDTSGLDDAVLEAARQNHPHLGESGERSKSDSYREPVADLDPFAGELPEPASKPREIGFIGGTALSYIRTVIAECAQEVGMSDARTADCVLAVNELTTNSVRHGRGHGTLRIWTEGDLLLSEVRDEGCIDDPLVGRRRPQLKQTDGRGLWVANQLCDLMQIRSDAHGTVVRLHMRSDGSPAAA
jgi:anti-sigma regulatory factor (Ser/Thr protein kinase)